jgi:predicted nuclease with TOPRIM domain
MATENRELVNVNKELVKENSELFKENNRLKKQSGTLNNQLHNNRIEMEQYKNKIDNYMSTYKKIKPNLDENRSLIDARLISVKEDVERHIDNLSILERNGITMIPDPYKYFS